MNDFTEILIFKTADSKLLILKQKLNYEKIDFVSRESTTYMEPAVEIRIKKVDIERVDKILGDISMNSTESFSNNTHSRQTSLFGIIRRYSSIATWTAIILTALLLIFLTKEIIQENIPPIALSTVIFIAGFIIYIGYREIKRN